MTNYRRLISYIYAYEGEVKGKNIGFAKLESRNGQCKLSVNVKKVYVGSSDLGVYLLAPGKEILLGNIFIRGGSGEFRATVSVANAADSGCSMDNCYGLTIHEADDAWRAYTTIWEDAIAHAAEVDLADLTSEKLGDSEKQIHKKVEELSREIGEERTPLLEASRNLEYNGKNSAAGIGPGNVKESLAGTYTMEKAEAEPAPGDMKMAVAEPDDVGMEVPELGSMVMAESEPEGMGMAESELEGMGKAESEPEGMGMAEAEPDSMGKAVAKPGGMENRETEPTAQAACGNIAVEAVGGAGRQHGRPAGQMSGRAYSQTGSRILKQPKGYSGGRMAIWQTNQPNSRAGSQPPDWTRENAKSDDSLPVWGEASMRTEMQEDMDNEPDSGSLQQRDMLRRAGRYPRANITIRQNRQGTQEPPQWMTMPSGTDNQAKASIPSDTDPLADPSAQAGTGYAPEGSIPFNAEDTSQPTAPDNTDVPSRVPLPPCSSVQHRRDMPPRQDMRFQRGMPQKGSNQPGAGSAPRPDMRANPAGPVPQQEAFNASVAEPSEDEILLGDPRDLERLEREEQEDIGPHKLWEGFRKRYPKMQAFDSASGCEILTIKPQDIGLLPRENWNYGNNSFLLHGYYNYRYLILARIGNEDQGRVRYILGVPGHYYSNEKYMASMFGFPHFVLSKKQPSQDGRFGYWYADIRMDNQD